MIDAFTTNVSLYDPKRRRPTYTHPDLKYSCVLLPFKNKVYLVRDAAQEALAKFVFKSDIRLLVDAQGDAYLLPVQHPTFGRQPGNWIVSRNRAVMRSLGKWVVLATNLSKGGYDILPVTEEMPEPKWPEAVMEDLVNVVFEGMTIDSPDHDVAQTLIRGY